GGSPFAQVPAAGPGRRLTFNGSGATLFGIQVVNACLILLTLGVYYFWGKAKVRAYLLSQTEFDGDRFAYHGTGQELFLGYLKAMVVIGVPVLLLSVPEIVGAPALVQGGAQLLLGILLMVFVPVAMVGARRYRLSRTSWRGIRFSFRGPVREFINLFLNGSLLTLLTLGIYYPYFLARRQAFMVSHSYLGSERFGFDGHGRELLWPWVGAALLFVPTLGLSWFWFSARTQRSFARHTTLGAGRFACTVRGRNLVALTLTNWLLIIGTLGIAMPWVTARSLRFTFRYLALEGAPDFSAVRQDARAASASGEGLSGLLDADFGVT
ncbi:MAG TPA: YjgN family protein, partial [Candidatus Limnocylindria bacterium]|nr:YjgN family protein [Candidatus Limnocylindria bacterium]